MSDPTAPEVVVGADLRVAMVHAAQALGDLANAETALLDGHRPQELQDALWQLAIRDVHRAWALHDHVVLRGAPLVGGGVASLILALLLGDKFRTYRGRQVVKQFTMSPWTRSLSHTTDDGHFHTDLNTADEPPKATIIQCVTADPGVPDTGANRVVRLRDLRDDLSRNSPQTVTFLEREPVSMLNDANPHAWRGRICEHGEIRYHPETLRAAQRRYGDSPPDLEDRLATIRAAAFRVSQPIHLRPGDALLVSNRRALHYRGPCSVRFRRFPRDFESRSINVLHLMDEPRSGP